MTLGVLTALPKELAAVHVMLDNPTRFTAPGQGGGRRYWIGEVPSAEGGVHFVAVAMLSDMGNNSAAIDATRLLSHFPNIEHLILCGIAGGVPRPGEPEHDVRLGDVVVSDRGGVVQYDLVKENPDGSKTHRHPPRPPGAALLEAVRHLESEALVGLRPWNEFLARGAKIRGATRPNDGVDAKGEPIGYPPDSEREASLPRIFAGTVAAANTLLKNPQMRDSLGSTFGVKAVEMEGSGVADAAWLSGRAGYLVVRGICDYCDERKGNVWQGYAAVAAAAYARALIGSMAPAHSESGGSPRHNARKALESLLIENRTIFETYGPMTPERFNCESDQPERWARKIRESILPNNRKILAILDENSQHMTLAEREILESFRQHADDFEAKHTGRDSSAGGLQFPVGLDKIFGDENGRQ